MNKILLFHSFNNTKNADPFYDLSISAYKQILRRNIEDLLLSDQVMISFDDGYKSILPAVDFAHELGFKTNVNIVTSKINKPGFLSDKDIKMLFNKRTLIGSHSHTHKDFLDYRSFVRKELTTSKKLLEDIIEVPVNYLSLPYGGYSQNTLYLVNKYFSKILISRPLFFKDQRLEGRLSIHKSNFLK